MVRIFYILIGLVIISALTAGVWLFFLSPEPRSVPTDTGGTFGTGSNQIVEVTPTVQNNTPQSTGNTTQTVQQKVFRVVNGPVVSATIVQYTRPTTTVARYVQQNNGHVFDLVLDSSGAVPKAISNTTIPGVARALWTRKGEGVILQYLDGNTTKTVSLGFPSQQSTSTQPVVIKFLPDGITDIAVSPSGTQVAYVLRTETGVRGYIAAPDGTGSRELFTIPLHEISLMWPNQNTLLAYTKVAYGVPGVAFSINVSSGATVPLLHALGLSVTADPTYSYLIYQTSGPSTYVRTLSSGQNSGLSFDPYPERCVWGGLATSTIYCATPLQYVAPEYLDLWHQGRASTPEGLISFTFPGGRSSILAIPGGDEGGIDSTIDTISVSPTSNYLLFVRRGDRSLWGVRL